MASKYIITDIILVIDINIFKVYNEGDCKNLEIKVFGLLFLLAVLQMAVLPGVLVLQLVRTNNLSPLTKYSLATMLSIIVNYLLCLTLIMLNLFTQSVMLCVVALECIALAFIYYKNRDKTITKQLLFIYKTPNDVLYNAVYTFALVVIALLLIKFFIEPYKYMGHTFKSNSNYLVPYTTFMGWDDIASWNTWAIKLFNSLIPSQTAGGYPIAIPAWWAVGYKIIDYPLEFLPKLVSGLWLPLALPLLLIEQGYIKRQLSIILSGIVITILWFKSKYMFSGMVDIPLATIGFTALYLLVESSKTTNRALLILAAILSLIAPIIKANGFFIVVAFTVGFYLLYTLTMKEKIKYSFFYLVMLIVIVIPWYGWWLYNMSIGNTHSNFSYVTNEIYKGKSELERAMSGFKNLFTTTNYWFGPIIMLSFFAKGKANRFLAYFGLAYLAYWACYISYDLRNGFLAWPFLVVSGMIVLERLIKFIYTCYKEPALLEHLYQEYAVIMQNYARVLMAIAMIGFVSICVLYPKERVVNKFNQLLLLRGDEVSKELDSIYKKDSTPKKFLSYFPPIHHRGPLSVWEKDIIFSWQKLNKDDINQYDYIILGNNVEIPYWDSFIKTEVIVKSGHITLYKVIK